MSFLLFSSNIVYSNITDNLHCYSCNVTFCTEDLFDHVCFITHREQEHEGCGNVNCDKRHCICCGGCDHKAIDHCDWCDTVNCKLNHCYACGNVNCDKEFCYECNEKECSYYHYNNCEGCYVCGEHGCNGDHCYKCETNVSKCTCRCVADDWCEKCDHSNAECVCLKKAIKRSYLSHMFSNDD